ncbi:MAG: hypothetical protein GKC10_07940 [Methanosarcinales archaeon]|nr:hypothetical protein [Methanosarcinales archaeon]
MVFALPSPEHRDKLIIRLEILDSKKVRGPNFAHLGSTVEAFAFDPPQGLGEGTEIVAEAEFLGDERGGKFRLTGIEVQG